MADQDKNDPEAARKAAEAEDERIRQHGKEIAQKALAVVNQPMKPPMDLVEACRLNEEVHGNNIVVAVPKRIVLVFDFPQHVPPFGKFWGSRLTILPGPQEMPEMIADHWWVRAHGVKPYTAPPVQPKNTFSKDDMQAEIRKAVAEALAEQGQKSQQEKEALQAQLHKQEEDLHAQEQLLNEQAQKLQDAAKSQPQGGDDPQQNGDKSKKKGG